MVQRDYGNAVDVRQLAGVCGLPLGKTCGSHRLALGLVMPALIVQVIRVDVNVNLGGDVGRKARRLLSLRIL